MTASPSVVSTDTCNRTTICKYDGKDNAGNVAIPNPVQLVASVLDTTPPSMSSTCAAGAICISETNFCFNTNDYLKRCYKDKCNGVSLVRMECQGCYYRDGTVAPSMACKEDKENGKFCITFQSDATGEIRPHCCSILVTVSDKCGNAQTTLQKVCYVPKGSASPYQCLPTTWLSTTTTVDTGATFSTSRRP